MPSPRRKVLILGSTGTIGTSALKVARDIPERMDIVGLAAQRSVDALVAQVADEVRTHFGDRVLKTTIPRSVRVSEAPSYGQTVVAYDPASAGALAYVEAARELASTSPERQAS